MPKAVPLPRGPPGWMPRAVHPAPRSWASRSANPLPPPPGDTLANTPGPPTRAGHREIEAPEGGVPPSREAVSRRVSRIFKASPLSTRPDPRREPQAEVRPPATLPLDPSTPGRGGA